MEVHRQTCQACGSIDVRNILVRKAERPATVFVRCGQCRELVACYELSDYYHHGKGIESYLKGRGASGSDSGRQWLAEFRRVQERSSKGYAEALEELEKDHREV